MIYEVDNLTFSYPGTERKVINKASLSIEEGETLCILGPNGAGKSTLLNCMVGLLKPEGGSIRICGSDISKMHEKEIAKIIGYVPQTHVPTFDYAVLDFVLMGRAHAIGAFGRPTKKDIEICMEALESMGIEDLAEKSYLNTSGGERQQILIARAIAQQPKAILFDEPTAHLDFGNQHRVLRRIKRMAEEGYSVVMTTHNPDHALLLGDKAAIVTKDGNIIQGRCSEIITEERLREVYDIELELVDMEAMGRSVCVVPNL